MARIRSVKPGICESETMARLPAEVERTYVRLWTHLDDDGRCKDNPTLIAAALFPLHADVTAEVIDGHLWALASDPDPCIVRYQVDGKRFLACLNWKAHQKPQKPRPSDFPAPDAGETVPVPDSYATPTGPVADESGPVVEWSGGGEVVGGVDGEVAIPNNVSEIPSPPAGTDRSADEVEQEARRALRLYADTVTSQIPNVDNFASYSGGVRQNAMGDGTMDQLRTLVRRGRTAEEAAQSMFGADPLTGPVTLTVVTSEAELQAQRDAAEAKRLAMLAKTEAEQAAPKGNHRAGAAAAHAALASGGRRSGDGVAS